MSQRTTPGSAPTTTHAEWGAGDPKLLVSREDDRFVHHIVSDDVRIGSAEGNELRLADSDPVHATITHDDRDEYVLTLHGAGEMNASPPAAEAVGGDRTEILRTGARFTAGPWTLVFNRAEFADHGRPFGGREGGELSDQPPQPPRPDYTGDSAELTDADPEAEDGYDDEPINHGGEEPGTLTRDIMTAAPRCIGENDSLGIAASVMSEWGVGALPICGEDRKLKGMLTDRDIVVGAVAEGLPTESTPARALARGKPVTVDASDDVRVALQRMRQHQIRRLPVLEDHVLVGIVSQADVARSLAPETTGAIVESISR